MKTVRVQFCASLTEFITLLGTNTLTGGSILSIATLGENMALSATALP